jgi:hypothetical protein
VPVTQRGQHWPAVVVVLAFLTAMVNLIVAAAIASSKVDGHFQDLWSLIRASPATAAIYMCAFFVGCATVSLLFNALFSFEASTRRLAWCVAGWAYRCLSTTMGLEQLCCRSSRPFVDDDWVRHACPCSLPLHPSHM